jgi:hypothetical protein
MKLLKNIYHNLSATPFLFITSFMLSRYLYNRGDLFIIMIIRPYIVIIVLTLLLSLIASLLIKDKAKRFISLSIFILFNFSYREIMFFLAQAGLTGLAHPYVFFRVWLGSMLIVLLLVFLTKKNLAPLNRFLFIFSVFAVLIPLAKMLPLESQRMLRVEVKSPLAAPEIVDKTAAKKNLPDIYYIIPDSYASPAILKEQLNYDNSAFVKYLEDKGFYVPRESTSNYPITFFSVESTLNMEYLDYLAKYKNSTDKTITIPLMNENNVKKFLERSGYKYYQIGSWWGMTNANPSADRNFFYENNSFSELRLFNHLILHTTLIGPLVEQLVPSMSFANLRANIRKLTLYQFEELPLIAKLDGPKFVFAHIIAPHDPYILNKDCGLVTAYDKKAEELYTDQVNCVSDKLRITIDGIIKNSVRPPVILIQSDEGAPDLKHKKTSEDDWEEADDEMLQEKFPVFAAYYLPGVSTSSLYSSISNVNSFRQIFNLYFGTALPVLPDKNYIFPNENNFYEFIDVTDRVNRN